MKALLHVTLLASSAAAAAEVVTFPLPGVRHLAHDGTDGRYHVVTLPLGEPSLRLRVTPEALRGKVVSAQAKAMGAEVAVNGNLFDPSFLACGRVTSDGVPWSRTYTEVREGLDICGFSAAWDERGQWLQFFSSVPNGTPPPAWATQVVSGVPFLVKGGVLCDGSQSAVCSFPSTLRPQFVGPRPRTMLGVDGSRTRLYLVVSDSPLSLAQAARFMRDVVGASDALNLDGGGSTTLYVAREGGVVNRPAEGTERQVSSAVVLTYHPAPDAGTGPDAGAADAGARGDGGADGGDSEGDAGPPLGEGDGGATGEVPAPVARAPEVSGCSHAPGGVAGIFLWLLAMAGGGAERRRLASRLRPAGAGLRSR